jgi:hypothetical protein
LENDRHAASSAIFSLEMVIWRIFFWAKLVEISSVQDGQNDNKKVGSTHSSNTTKTV